MRIELVLDAARLRQWHLDLARRLRDDERGVATRLRLSDGPALPSSIDLLVRLERLVHRLPARRPSEAVEPKSADGPRFEGAPDIVLDLRATDGAPAPADARSLRLLYDGVPDEGALWAALLEGRAPRIEVADEGGRILAAGLPSTENARSLPEAYEAVVARVPILVLAAIRRPSALRLPGAAPTPPAAGGGVATAGYAARSLATAAVRRLYRLCFHAPHWRIGWRFVADHDVWDTHNLGGPAWRVLPDPGTRFYADPFPVEWRGRTYLFCEDFDHATAKGVISAATFDGNGPATPMTPVLEEPWHLSYPFLIAHAGEIWMIPESSANRTVTLYRAAPFPSRWVPEATLLSGLEASDATIVRKGARFWMFATVRDGVGSHSDTLAIFLAEDLLGPWRPHPSNPVLVDSASARPAGNFVRRGSRLWRPVQDCRGGYGAALGLAEVTRLDETGFEQVIRQVIGPDRRWPGRRLHTLNRAGRLETIDGSGLSPKLKLAPDRLLSNARWPEFLKARGLEAQSRSGNGPVAPARESHRREAVLARTETDRPA